MMFLGNDHWYNAYIAITIVSILPNLLLIFIPFSVLKEKTYRGFNVRHILLCFAAAGLLGDVFLHTIPHLLGDHHHDHNDDSTSSTLLDSMFSGAFMQGHGFPHEHSHENDHQGHNHDEESRHDFKHEHDEHNPHFKHDHHHEERGQRELHEVEHSYAEFAFLTSLGLERSLIIQLMIVGGFLLFFMAEKIATGLSGGGHSHSHGHGHGHDHNSNDSSEDKKKDDVSGEEYSGDKTCADKEKSVLLTKSKTIQKDQKESTSLLSAMRTKMQASGWLNLLADSMHNFTDGIAIGASFASSGHGLGFATFISVVLHEIPHEIGDFTILINNGLSKSEAIRAQFMTAIAAVLGTAVGLLAQRNKELEEVMLAVSTGGFLYIATVNILPDIVREKSSVTQTLLEIGAFVLGILMMALVTLLE